MRVICILAALTATALVNLYLELGPWQTILVFFGSGALFLAVMLFFAHDDRADWNDDGG